MQTITINATVKGENGKGDITKGAPIKMGDNVEELVELFGEDVIYNHARRSIQVAAQTYIKKHITDEEDDDTIASCLKDWKPTVRRASKDPVAKAEEEFRKMSPEDKKKFLKLAREISAS